MQPAPARRAVRRGLALAIGLVLGLSGPGSGAAGPPSAHATTSAPGSSPAGSPASGDAALVARQAELCERPSPESPVVVDVTTLTPRAPTEADEAFHVAGRLVNCGTTKLRGLQVRLVVGSRIRTRSGLQRAAADPDLGTTGLTASAAQDSELGPGESTSFDVRTDVGDLRLGEHNGVYPLAVQARARSDGRSRRPVGAASTFVPWFPEGPVAPTRVAWVVPVVEEPRRAPGEVLLDDRLDELLQDGPDPGRLARVLRSATTGARGACDRRARDAGAVADAPPASAARREAPCRGERVPLTYAVDADLLDTVEDMTHRYRVLRDGRRVELPASEHAVEWLEALRSAVTASDEAAVLALPYGDPDVVALSRTDSPVKDDVALLERLGESETRRLLPGADLVDVAWPPTGPVAGVVDPLAAGADTALLLDESALVTDPGQDRTPSARKLLLSTLDPVTALVADDVLSSLVAPDPADDGWQGARLAEQRWIAETAIIAAERPGESRTLVVAPDRQADLLPAVAGQVIADTGRLPWLCGVPLADVSAGRERCATLPDAQGPAAADEDVVLRSTVGSSPPLSPAYVAEIGQARRAADQLTEQVLVADSDEARSTKARLLRARGRTASTAWREAPARGRRLLDLLQADIAGLRGRISLVGTPTTLTGRTGTLQLAVQNDLDQPVTVGVRLDPTSAVRLTSQDTELQVVPARTTQPVSVRVEARTSGRFTARAGLVDASGRPFGSTVELQIRSTRYGRVALGVTGAAAAVLFVAAGIRITRRALRGPAPG